MWQGLSPVSVQMWMWRERSHRRRCRCGGRERSPDADVTGVSPVPAGARADRRGADRRVATAAGASVTVTVVGTGAAAALHGRMDNRPASGSPGGRRALEVGPRILDPKGPAWAQTQPSVGHVPRAARAWKRPSVYSPTKQATKHTGQRTADCPAAAGALADSGRAPVDQRHEATTGPGRVRSGFELFSLRRVGSGQALAARG